MIRAAAKNYLRVAAIVDPADYSGLVSFLRDNKGQLSLSKRFELARKAFVHTAAYDQAIARYLAEQSTDRAVSVYALE